MHFTVGTFVSVSFLKRNKYIALVSVEFKMYKLWIIQLKFTTVGIKIIAPWKLILLNLQAVQSSEPLLMLLLF